MISPRGGRIVGRSVFSPQQWPMGTRCAIVRGRAALLSDEAGQNRGAQSPSEPETVHRAAPSKNKKKNDDLCSSPINRPPLRGFWHNATTQNLMYVSQRCG